MIAAGGLHGQVKHNAVLKCTLRMPRTYDQQPWAAPQACRPCSAVRITESGHKIHHWHSVRAQNPPLAHRQPQRVGARAQTPPLAHRQPQRVGVRAHTCALNKQYHTSQRNQSLLAQRLAPAGLRADHDRPCMCAIMLWFVAVSLPNARRNVPVL